MNTCIKGVKKGDSIVRKLEGQSFVSFLAPEDGVIIQQNNGPRTYIRKSDLLVAVEKCGDNDDPYEADVWSNDGETQTEQVSTEGRRNSG